MEENRMGKEEKRRKKRMDGSLDLAPPPLDSV
jgi:hypothetical protein